MANYLAQHSYWALTSTSVHIKGYMRTIQPQIPIKRQIITQTTAEQCKKRAQPAIFLLTLFFILFFSFFITPFIKEFMQCFW